MRWTIQILLILTLATLTMFGARAHEGATGIVKERMDGMKRLGAVSKEIADKLRGNRNLASIAEDAAALIPIARRIADWFPAGSMQPPTEALPAIWEREADFNALARALEQELAKLETAARTGEPQAVARQFGITVLTCKGCHRDFRKPQ